MRPAPVTRREFQRLAELRTNEASILVQRGKQQGAYYLAGYAVECALKACIAKETRRSEFPDKKRVDSSHSHNFEKLVKVAGLEEARIRRDGEDPEFRKNWDVAQAWSEESRYRRHRPESAQSL